MKEQIIGEKAILREAVQIGGCILPKKSIVILKEFIKELEINPDNDEPLKSTKFCDFIRNNYLTGVLSVGRLFDTISLNGLFDGFYRDFFGNLFCAENVIYNFDFVFCDGKPHRIDISITIKVRQDFSFKFAEFLKIIELIKID